MPKITKQRSKLHPSASNVASKDQSEKTTRDINLLLNYGIRKSIFNSIQTESKINKASKTIGKNKNKNLSLNLKNSKADGKVKLGRWQNAAKIIAEIKAKEKGGKSGDIVSAPVPLLEKPSNLGTLPNGDIGDKDASVYDKSGRVGGLDNDEFLFQKIKSKKEKQHEKKSKWKSQLEETKIEIANDKKQMVRKKAKSALIRGFDDLGDILEDLNDSQTESTSKSKSRLKNKKQGTSAGPTTTTGTDKPEKSIYKKTGNPARQKRSVNKAALDEITRFTQVLSNSTYKSNPLKVIKQHLSNTI